MLSVSDRRHRPQLLDVDRVDTIVMFDVQSKGDPSCSLSSISDIGDGSLAQNQDQVRKDYYYNSEGLHLAKAEERVEHKKKNSKSTRKIGRHQTRNTTKADRGVHKKSKIDKKKSRNKKKRKDTLIQKVITSLNEEAEASRRRALYEDFPRQHVVEPSRIDPSLTGIIGKSDNHWHQLWQSTSQEMSSSCSNSVRDVKTISTENDSRASFSRLKSEKVVQSQDIENLFGTMNPQPTIVMASRFDEWSSEETVKYALVIESELQQGDSQDIELASWFGNSTADARSKSSKSKGSWVASWTGKFSSDGTTSKGSWVASWEGKFSSDGTMEDRSWVASFRENDSPPLSQFDGITRYLRYIRSRNKMSETYTDVKGQNGRDSILGEGDEIEFMKQWALAEKHGLELPRSYIPTSDDLGDVSLRNFPLPHHHQQQPPASYSQQQISPQLAKYIASTIGVWNPDDPSLVPPSVQEIQQWSNESAAVGGDTETGEVLSSDCNVMSTDTVNSPYSIAHSSPKPISPPQSFQRHLRGLIKRRQCNLLVCLLLIGILGVSGMVAYFLCSIMAGPMQTVGPSFSPTSLVDVIFEAAIGISGRESLLIPGSPQIAAVSWMSTFDQYMLDYESDTWKERYALVVLYLSTSGSQWLRTDRWLEPNLHHCDWSESISCELQPTRHRLTYSIDLTRFGLKGIIPKELSVLTKLRTLILSQNQLSGSLPSCMFMLSHLNKLEIRSNFLAGTLPWSTNSAQDLAFLDLSDNKLTGTLDDTLFNLTRLQYLDLSSNQLVGTLSSNLGFLSVLGMLNLGNNRFSGNLPVVFDEVPRLESILLAYNQFTGTIAPWNNHLLKRLELDVSHNLLTGTLPGFSEDDFLDRTFHLRKINVGHNRLVGTIPMAVGLIPTMVALDVSDNLLSGTFPNLGWASLEYIGAANNRLTGAVPYSFDPTRIQHINVSGNRLQGVIPIELYGFSNLEHVILSNNELSGSIATDVGRLTALRSLEMQTCGLSDTLPTQIGELTRLEIIDLGGNFLRGTLPTELGLLKVLMLLKLDSNEFSSTIPSELAQLSMMRELDLSNNSFTGTLPTGTWTGMDVFAVNGNPGLTGSVPAGLCTSALISVDVGCNLECTCCVDCVIARGTG